MMKKITLLLLLLTVSFGYSQSIPVTFSEGITAASWKADSGLASVAVVVDPDTGSGDVGQMTSSVAGFDYQNAQITFQAGFYKIDLSGTNKTITFDYYSNEATGGLLKVENGIAAENKELPFSYDTANVWETITLDFATVSANAQYNKLVFFPHLGNGGPKNSTKISYIDNVTGVVGDLILPPAGAPTVAAPTPPARAASDVVSFYSNAYTNTTNWGEIQVFAGSLTDEVIDGNNTYRLAPGSGFQYNYYSPPGTSEDLSGMTHYHVDIYVQGNISAGEVFTAQAIADADESNNFYQAPITATGEWISVDVPLSSFLNAGGNTNYDNIRLLQILLQGPAFGPVYFDNLYFHKNTTLGTKDFEIAGLNVYPNPTQDSWTVKTQNIKMSSIQVFDILGKQVLSLTPEATEAKIDASVLKSGLYFAKINTANGSSSLKLVRQ